MLQMFNTLFYALILLDHTYTATTALNYPVTSSTITFLIPNYRDILCSYTIHNIFLKALYHSRVYVSVVQELYKGDPNCVTDLYNNTLISAEEKLWILNNVRYLTKKAENAVGLHMNVYQAELLTPETENGFVIKIDAHSDFLLHYDKILIEYFNKIGDEMAVLSSYPLGVEYLPELGFSTGTPNIYGKMCIMKQNDQGLLYLPVELTDYTKSCFSTKGYCKGFFVPGNFHFARDHLIKNVPYDKYLNYFFNGEQFLFSARLYTHGYNIYTPALNFVFHVYGKNWTNRQKFEGPKTYNGVSYMRSLGRYKHELGIKINSTGMDIETGELENFGIGKQRPLEDFYKMIDIDGNKEYYKDAKLAKDGILNACVALDKANSNY